MRRSTSSTTSVDYSTSWLRNSNELHLAVHEAVGASGAMITSEREYRITKVEARRFEEAIASARERSASTDVDPPVHDAMIEALESELAVLRKQLATYEGLKGRN
jgi:hypothetical protein